MVASRTPLLAFACLACVASAQMSAERNSFLAYRVTTTQALVREVSQNRDVQQRFMRHFGMTRSQVIDYVSGLHPARLSEKTAFTVYSIPRNGMVKQHTQTFRRGELVFEDSAGTPVLIARCGNPVTLGPQNLTEHARPNVLGADTPTTDLREMAGVEQPAAEALAPFDLLAPGVPILAELPPATQPIVPPVTPPVVPPKPQLISGGPSFLPLLLLGGIPFALNTSGPAPVPEPASAAVLAIGLGAVMFRRARKAR